MEADLDREWRVLGFDLRLGVRYHQERRRFFERWNMLATWLGFVLGSGTAASLLGHKREIAIALSVILTVLQGANLAIGFAKMAWTHADLMRKFSDLEIRWRSAAKSDASYVELQNARVLIEKEEPPPMPYLVRRCQIEIMRRDGNKPEHFPKIGRLQHMFAHYLPSLS